MTVWHNVQGAPEFVLQTIGGKFKNLGKCCQSF